MTIQITIVGLGQVGCSIGLALKEQRELVRRVGHDREPNLARQAEKLGAVDQISYNLPSAVRQSDVVVLCEPVDQAQETLGIIIQDLKEGAVVMDTSPLKISTAEKAAGLMPEDRHYVAITPTLNPVVLEGGPRGIDGARADLFKNSIMVITAPTGAHPEAIKLASDLATLLGASTLFGDPHEMDGLLAACHILPKLTAAALLNATIPQPGWREARKIAGRPYAEATASIVELDEAAALGQTALLNRQNVVRVLDNLIESLTVLRDAVERGEADTLKQELERAQRARSEWVTQRLKGKWDDEDIPAAEMPAARDVLGKLIGIGRKPGIGR
jgi:prephenate dehydrogenase